MKKLIGILACSLMVPAYVSGQNADDSSRLQGYAFVGPILSGPSSAVVQRGGVNTGFGGELLYHGLGVDVEPGFAHSTGGANVGVGSIDFSYHFMSNHRIEPFVNLGYSLYFGQRTYTENGWNAGGGFNYWAAKHVGLRFDIRGFEDIGNEEFEGIENFTGFRFGVTFR